MLEKIFSFGKARGKQSDNTTGKYRTITEEEYQRYVFEDELFKIIVETEAALHNIEDPVEIAAEATGNSMMKERYDQMARDELPEEEYQKVQHFLEIRTHKEE